MVLVAAMIAPAILASGLLAAQFSGYEKMARGSAAEERGSQGGTKPARVQGPVAPVPDDGPLVEPPAVMAPGVMPGIPEQMGSEPLRPTRVLNVKRLADRRPAEHARRHKHRKGRHGKRKAAPVPVQAGPAGVLALGAGASAQTGAGGFSGTAAAGQGGLGSATLFGLPAAHDQVPNTSVAQAAESGPTSGRNGLYAGAARQGQVPDAHQPAISGQDQQAGASREVGLAQQQAGLAQQAQQQVTNPQQQAGGAQQSAAAQQQVANAQQHAGTVQQQVANGQQQVGAAQQSAAGQQVANPQQQAGAAQQQSAAGQQSGAGQQQAGAVQQGLLDPTPMPEPYGPARIYEGLIRIDQPQIQAPALGPAPGRRLREQPRTEEPEPHPQESSLMCPPEWRDTWLWELCQDHEAQL
ncbi:hypothetical protein [Microbispora corallina]|nr:hypothetical protein [Microbispora corallina]